MRKEIAVGGLMIIAAVALAEPAMAQELSSSGVMNDVLKRFNTAAASWGAAIEAAASRLFWTLVLISMVFTFGMMALRKADLSEFFAEFVKFTITTGFYWWLLTNANQGMNIAGTIVESLQMLGAQAGGLSDGSLGPSSILDIGFELYDKTVQATSELGWREMAKAIIMEALALAVLFIMALISVSLLVMLASAWILLYAGVFFLGFGGSRWTSDMAINYYKAVLGVAASLFAMVLIVSIGKGFTNHYYSQISENMASQELAVMMVISIILMFLINKVPPMISGLVSGGAIGAASGVGNFGAGAAVGAAVTAASMAAAGAAVAGKAVMGAAASATGGASAIQAAFQSAQAAERAGSGVGDLMSAMGGNTSSGGNEAGSAFGDDSGGDGGGSPVGGGSDSNSTGSDESGGQTSQAQGDETLSGKAAGSDSKESGDGGEKSGGMMAKAGRIAAGTANTLAQGMASAASSKLQGRIADTAGGRLAASIQERRLETENAASASVDYAEPSFQGNNLSGGSLNDEVAEFVNRKPPQE